MIHQLADVATNQIGQDTNVWQYCVILPGAIIGNNCNINCHVFIENDVVIEDEVTIKSGVYLWDGIRIGKKVFIGPNATFINNPLPRSRQYPEKHVGCNIQEGATIGANSTIMSQIEIGKYSMIGAGSLVTHNVLDFELVYGNPARHQGWVDIEGRHLYRTKDSLWTNASGILFEETEKGLKQL